MVDTVFYFIIVFSMFILMVTCSCFFEFGLGGDHEGPAMVKVAIHVDFAKIER